MHANGSVGSVLVDALLSAASAAVGLLAGMTFLGVRADPAGVAFVALVAFASAFISSLQAARGRHTGVKQPPRRPG